MKKKLTLNQTWKYCLQMWKWMVEQIKKDKTLDIEDLKSEWMKKHPRFGKIDHNCFFCEHDEQCGGENCEFCPVKLLLKSFRTFHCANQPYDYRRKPIKFYRKLVELNEKRKSK